MSANAVLHRWSSSAGAKFQVVIADLDVAAPRLRQLIGAVSVDEVRRAARLRSTTTRLRYLASRGLLRNLLSERLDTPPQRLELVCDERGKPLPVGGLAYSTSRSGGVGAFAFAFGSAVGVDIERTRPISAASRIATHVFAVEEAAQILAAPEGTRAQLFLTCWARKEAYLKAIGEGLSRSLNTFTVSIHPDLVPTIVRDPAAGGGRVALRDIPAVQGCVGAVCIASGV